LPFADAYPFTITIPPMTPYLKTIELRWADLDPNFHLRHSVYYDYGATARIEFLQLYGITVDFMQQHTFGPIIFREECVFRKEIRLKDVVTIDAQLKSSAPDLSRWTIQHNIFKNGDTLSAILTLDGAWMDTSRRKLTVPPEEVRAAFEKMPKVK
jgi:acyl-CoA thioester hydrolase